MHNKYLTADDIILPAVITDNFEGSDIGFASFLPVCDLDTKRYCVAVLFFLPKIIVIYSITACLYLSYIFTRSKYSICVKFRLPVFA